MALSEHIEVRATQPLRSLRDSTHRLRRGVADAHSGSHRLDRRLTAAPPCQACGRRRAQLHMPGQMKGAVRVRGRRPDGHRHARGEVSAVKRDVGDESRRRSVVKCDLHSEVEQLQVIGQHGREKGPTLAVALKYETPVTSEAKGRLTLRQVSASEDSARTSRCLERQGGNREEQGSVLLDVSGMGQPLAAMPDPPRVVA